MKVPLAGPHKDLPPLPTDQEQSSQAGQSTPPQIIQRSDFATTSGIALSRPTRPPSTPVGPPPPHEPSFFARMLPFVFGFLFLAAMVFLAIRIVPGFFGKSLSGPVELVYWGLWEESQVLDTIIKEYQREHPNVTIKYEKQNIKQYREALSNRLSGEGGPDIFRFHNTWVPMMRDYLAPIPSNVYTNEEFENTFYEVATKDLQVGDSFVGIPLEIDTLALFINEDDFRAAGLSPPKTWKELLDAAYQIRVFDSEKRITKAGVALGTFDNIDHASDILALMMLQNGVDLKKVDKTTTRDGSRNLGEDTLSYYVRFSQGENRVWDDTLDPSTLAFAKEKLAMYFGYSWRVFEIKAVNPSLRFKIVPVPQLPGTNTTFASYWVEGVSKKSRYQKEAFEFLKFLLQDNTMEKLYAEQAKLRLFGEPYSRVDLADTLKNNELVWPFVEQAKNASSWYLASNTYDNGINDRMITYFADAINAVGTKNVSPKTALETVAKGVSLVASQYGL